ncbi:unnamed protein product [Caenorhabditis sp. 36 PRJEB53466]|nr:unnamed protein product [Caenorhabditis sp. 36 PRJEB53466]
MMTLHYLDTGTMQLALQFRREIFYVPLMNYTFPDHNQSPRNVYQCQMGKQTMGTAVHAWHARAANKMYRLQFPQQPLLKLEAYEKYQMDEYYRGTGQKARAVRNLAEFLGREYFSTENVA